ncbi:MAG: hypothetical protein ACLSA2_00605 [Candidatus Gastranaerophilaceae bacterium]
MLYYSGIDLIKRGSIKHANIIKLVKQFVDLSDVELEQIAHELTMSGLEVEAIDEVKPQFTNKNR